jgi:hypothetical protein
MIDPTGSAFDCSIGYVAGTHTAPEAAVASWRLCAPTSWDATGASGHSEDRSAHVSDLGPRRTNPDPLLAKIIRPAS